MNPSQGPVIACEDLTDFDAIVEVDHLRKIVRLVSDEVYDALVSGGTRFWEDVAAKRSADLRNDSSVRMT